MPKIERMDFPRKLPLANSGKLLILLAVALGIWIHQCTQKELRESIVLSEVSVANYSTGHIELAYKIQNLKDHDQEVRLLAKVWDENEEEIASIMFLVNLKAGIIQNRTKIIDKLNRAIRDGEVPHRAAIRVYERKLL
jgi:diphthamide synthase (EF-2-diphthine--ammonia ligase)